MNCVKHLFLPVVLLVTMLNCMPSPKAVPERDHNAKRFLPISDRALVYVYRSESAGSGTEMSIAVYVDSRKIGGSNLKPSTFCFFETDPGPCKIILWAGKDKQEIAFTIQRGNIYFVKQKAVSHGVLASGGELELAKDETAKAEIATCSLVEGPSSSLPNARSRPSEIEKKYAGLGNGPSLVEYRDDGWSSGFLITGIDGDGKSYSGQFQMTAGWHQITVSPSSYFYQSSGPITRKCYFAPGTTYIFLPVFPDEHSWSFWFYDKLTGKWADIPME